MGATMGAVSAGKDSGCSRARSWDKEFCKYTPPAVLGYDVEGGSSSRCTSLSL